MFLLWSSAPLTVYENNNNVNQQRKHPKVNVRPASIISAWAPDISSIQMVYFLSLFICVLYITLHSWLSRVHALPCYDCNLKNNAWVKHRKHKRCSWTITGTPGFYRGFWEPGVQTDLALDQTCDPPSVSSLAEVETSCFTRTPAKLLNITDAAPMLLRGNQFSINVGGEWAHKLIFILTNRTWTKIKTWSLRQISVSQRWCLPFSGSSKHASVRSSAYFSHHFSLDY